MSLDSYNPHNRYRRRSINRVIGFTRTATVLLVAGAIGFWLGRAGDEQRANSLRAQLEDVQQQRQEAEAMLMELRTEAQTATMRYEQLQNDLAEKMPEGGPMEELVALISTQLEEGMDPEKLAFAIRSARPPRNCTEPETRRFVISTPAYQGADSQIEITEGGITITGSGSSAKDKDGKAEAWYDPSKSVAINFTVAGGAAVEKKGVMPLQHSVVAGARQYRFTIEEGARSFAKVTFDSCDYP